MAPLHRSGGQAQFILRNRVPLKHIAGQTELDELLGWIEQEAHRDLTLGDIADRAAMSVRTVNRRFQAETRVDLDIVLQGAHADASGIKNPEDARTINNRARELGFSTSIGIIHDGSGRLKPLGPVQVTDGTQSGAVTTTTTAQPPAPSTGIP